MKHTWIAYGIDMEGIQTVTTEGVNINESHDKAVKHFNESEFDWDCCMSYESYVKEWESKYINQ